MDAARYLGLSERDVEQLVREGRLKAQTLGGRFVRFDPEQVKQLKPALPVPAHPAVASKALPVAWLDRAVDFLYFYDFYLISFLFLMGVAVYLMSTG